MTNSATPDRGQSHGQGPVSPPTTTARVDAAPPRVDDVGDGTRRPSGGNGADEIYD